MVSGYVNDEGTQFIQAFISPGLYFWRRGQ